MSDPDLLDMRHSAAHLGISYASVRRYRQGGVKPPFPEPAAHYGASPVWRREQLDTWQAQRPGRTGRPRTNPTPQEN